MDLLLDYGSTLLTPKEYHEMKIFMPKKFKILKY